MKVDAVLIDNDATLVLCWKLIGDRVGKEVRAFPSVEAFLKVQASFDRDQIIYLDSDLGEGLPRGELEAKRLSELGFCEIYLETGNEPENFPRVVFPWLKGVVGKEAPWISDAEEMISESRMSESECCDYVVEVLLAQ